jgi:hypothetical protein
MQTSQYSKTIKWWYETIRGLEERIEEHRRIYTAEYLQLYPQSRYIHTQYIRILAYLAAGAYFVLAVFFALL